jgi:hypothetical protein
MLEGVCHRRGFTGDCQGVLKALQRMKTLIECGQSLTLNLPHRIAFKADCPTLCPTRFRKCVFLRGNANVSTPASGT